MEERVVRLTDGRRISRGAGGDGVTARPGIGGGGRAGRTSSGGKLAAVTSKTSPVEGRAATRRSSSLSKSRSRRGGEEGWFPPLLRPHSYLYGAPTSRHSSASLTYPPTAAESGGSDLLASRWRSPPMRGSDEGRWWSGSRRGAKAPLYDRDASFPLTRLTG
ncbi:hypothetical protein Sjap_003317 [Stephania japonica]|uniref:Uncharacterized protein n=1 Tax=Stephania japonica TaxID=461633 RepID=A0AAP0KQL8_9MAGN